MNQAKNIHNETTIHQAWNGAKGALEFSFVFAFQTKEQYLSFRRLWKEHYAALSRTIRSQKQLVRSTMRRREYAGKIQSEIHKLKADARVQLAMLAAAKHEGNRQYMRNRQTTG